MDNRRHRQEEGRREQFALAEKARRLQALREEHLLMLHASVRTVTEESETSDFGRLSQRLTLAPGGRLRRAKSAGKRTKARWILLDLLEVNLDGPGKMTTERRPDDIGSGF